MGALDRVFEDEVLVRQYLASVIGPTRAPFGQRKPVTLAVGESVDIAQNSTRDRVLFVTVTRANIVVNAAAATVTFSQQSQVSTNDFERPFPTADIFRFTLRPGESLSMLLTGAAAPTINFSFGIDTF